VLRLSAQGTGAPRRASRSRSSVGDSRVAKLARHAFRKHVESLVDGHLVGLHALQAGRPLGGQVEEERLRGEVDLRAVRRGLVLREIAWIAFFQALLELAVVPDGLPYRVHQVPCRGTEGRVLRAAGPLHQVPAGILLPRARAQRARTA